MVLYYIIWYYIKFRIHIYREKTAPLSRIHPSHKWYFVWKRLLVSEELLTKNIKPKLCKVSTL